MIVKNESKIIERCLDSAKDVIDCISIADTGSTDNTVELIAAYMKKHNIPGKVHHHQWENFGINRSLSVTAAQEMLKELNFPLDKTFLLLLDADMMLEVDPKFTKDSLISDTYLMAQRNSSIIYDNTRLIRASLPWTCVGVTHEYWACKQYAAQGKIKTLSIDDRNDGGSKADKYERDIRLLTQGLKDDPENERYLFYLAQSYICLGEHDTAIPWYKARIEKGGFYEEVWYSKYMIGQCYEAKGDWEKAVVAYLDAYQFNPRRAEPLHQLTSYYRGKEKHDLVCLYAKQGVCIPYPTNDGLFVSYPVYEYLFDEDLSISGYYTNCKDEGFAATNRLLLNKKVPQNLKEQAKQNLLFYVEKLKNAKYQPIAFNRPLIREGLTSLYNASNPSIKKTKTGYDVICRTVNYIQIGATHFQSLDVLDPVGTIRTKNFLLQYNKDFDLIAQQEIIEDKPRMKWQTRNVEGLEDCRIFDFQDSSWFTCTTLDTNSTGQPQISLCKIGNARSASTVPVERLAPLMGPDTSRCEKNWMPLVKDGEIHFIYSYDPMIVYKPNINNHYCVVTPHMMSKNTVPAHDFSSFSGSAAPIPFKDGYLMMIHEVIRKDYRNYLHRFVYLDKDLNIEKVSKPFIFFHQGIEYTCGMTIDHSMNNLVIGVGVEDREAYLCTLPLDTVVGMLESLPPVK